MATKKSGTKKPSSAKRKTSAPKKRSATKAAKAKASGARNKAAAPGAPVVRQGDKAAFVRSLPRSMAAGEVVDRARERGMVISKAYVHNIRSAANKAARALMAKEGKRTVKGPKNRLESQFRELVISLGPARAKKLLSQVETSLALAAAS